MDPTTLLILIALGIGIGCSVGFLTTGSGYGWAFNAVAGSMAAVFCSRLFDHTPLDMGVFGNALMAAAAGSVVTSYVLRS